MLQVLAPGMEHRQKSALGTQVLGIGRNLQEGFGGGAEQEVVNRPLVLEGQRRDRLGQREDDVKVLHRQQLGGALLEPDCPGRGLALRTVPIAAGTIRDQTMAAAVALRDVATEGGGATDRDILQRFPVAAGKRLAARRAVSGSVAAKNVGQLQRWRVHRASAGSIGAGSRSSGLTVDRTARLETCKYLAVVFKLRCPMRIWIRRRSVASSSRWVAKQCRKVCGETGLESCAAAPACLQIVSTLVRLIGCSGRLPAKSQVVGR